MNYITKKNNKVYSHKIKFNSKKTKLIKNNYRRCYKLKKFNHNNDFQIKRKKYILILIAMIKIKV